MICADMEKFSYIRTLQKRTRLKAGAAAPASSFLLQFVDNSCILHSGGAVAPCRKGVLPMQYVTYEVLIQLGLLIVGIIGLVYEITRENGKK